MENTEFISLKNIQKSYAGRTVLKDINLNIASNDFITIKGKSGAGKSTLLNIIALFEFADWGRYELDGVNILKKKKIHNHIRNEKIGFVFQAYNLLFNMTVKENVLLPIVYSKQKIEQAQTNQRFYELVDILDIAHLENEHINHLSGGEKQRVALARGLIMNPKLLIADEPTGNLDKECSKTVIELMKKINSLGTAVLIVTHDENIANYGSKKYYLNEGVLHNV